MRITRATRGDGRAAGFSSQRGEWLRHISDDVTERLSCMVLLRCGVNTGRPDPACALSIMVATGGEWLVSAVAGGKARPSTPAHLHMSDTRHHRQPSVPNFEKVCQRSTATQ
jgi:hypothetical protein